MNLARDTAPSLDGRTFVTESSTNSAVSADSPSVFQYFERDGVVWGGYEGDTVAFGKVVGKRVGNDLHVSFVHVLSSDGCVIAGTASNVIEVLPNGTLRLVEHFHLDGVEHESVCVEV